MTALQSLYAEAVFRLAELTWIGVVDLLLVTIAFYFILNLVRHSRVAFLLRGVLTLTIALFVVSVILPLPAFVWVVRTALIAIFVATPIILQPELRRVLERVGRRTGLTTAVRQTATEGVVLQLVRAVENMAESRVGALIVLEGNQSLQGVIETGVPIGGQASSELLQAIFFPENPLHDGAAVLREDRIMAAGCVLPLTQRIFNFQRRLGTRHRAAVGMSESSDALIVVVSEETGEFSVARHGHLQYGLDRAALREQLFDFFAPPTDSPPTFSVSHLLRQAGRSVWHQFRLPTLRQFVSNLGLFFISFLLGLVVWSFVIQQTNPAKRGLVEEIPLRVENIPPGTTLVTEPPETVSAIIQTTDDVLSTLSTNSFQAVVSLEELPPGLHHLPVQVNSGASPLQIISVTPPTVDLEIAAIISDTVPVTINIPDINNLSPAFRIAGSATTSPNQVQIIGPAPLVERVNQIQATVSVANARSSLQETVPVQALDELGQQVTGINIQPSQVQVNVPIRRRLNTLEVGIRAIITGTPPAGYWMRELIVTPATVTLQGNQEQLLEVGNFVNTLPVDVSQATGDLSVEIPLDLSPNVQVFDSEGNAAKTVTVQASIVPRRGDLALTQPVELVGASSGITITVTPPEVDVLLSGPLPTLSQIERDPNLVQVLVDISQLTPNQSADLKPTVIVPENIQAQVVPPSVLVDVTR